MKATRQGRIVAELTRDALREAKTKAQISSVILILDEFIDDVDVGVADTDVLAAQLTGI